MWHRQHLSWFPFLFIAVTLILAVTIVFVSRQQGPSAYQAVVDVGATGIDEMAYRAQVRTVVAPLWDMTRATSGDVAEVQALRDQVLAMRVPADDRDVHIQLVAALHALERAWSTGTPDALADAQVRLSALVQVAPWLQEALP